MANVYAKYCPNVWVAKCEEQHQKGDVIDVETKYGKVNECIVWNLVLEREGFHYYSITRADGFNHQEHAKAKADRWRGWAEGHRANSDAAFEASHNAVEGIPFGQPILVGHYSERKHRAAIERSARAIKIDLSMPESVEYFRHKLGEAKEYHEGLKSGKYPREHSYSLTYAKKAVNEMQKNYDTAVKLWGE